MWVLCHRDTAELFVSMHSIFRPTTPDAKKKESRKQVWGLFQHTPSFYAHTYACSSLPANVVVDTRTGSREAATLKLRAGLPGGLEGASGRPRA